MSVKISVDCGAVVVVSIDGAVVKACAVGEVIECVGSGDVGCVVYVDGGGSLI